MELPTFEADHRIAVFGHVAEAHVLATELIHVLKLQPLDAVMASRHTPGLLPCPVTADQAEAITGFLRRLGIQAQSLPGKRLPSLISARTIHHARCLADGLEVLSYTGSSETLLPWQDIAVVAVGRVPGKPSLHFLENGRPSVVSAAPLPEVSRVQSPRQPILELWLIPAATDQRAGVIRHNQFNYDGLDQARSSSATSNFEHFVRELVGHCPAAQLTASTHGFLGHHILAYDFATSAELQEQALLAWTMREATKG